MAGRERNSAEGAGERRRTGRPRSTPTPGGEDPETEILRAAGRLFGERGVAGTTMTELARAAGLRQSSLYYWFSRKEEVVAALVARANVVPLQLLDRIEADGGPPAVRLYRFVRADTVALCELPVDINEIHRIAARDRDGFHAYWRERRAMERRIGAVLRDGVADGSFREVDVRLTALTVLSTDEGTQNWFRLGSRRSPRTVATALADLVVGGLLRTPSALDRVRRAADELDDRSG